MVDTNHEASTSQLTPPGYTIEEQALIAKTGHDEDCEDAISIGPAFVAVIDGATSKTERRWQEQTGGRIAAVTLKEAFTRIPPEATAREAVDLLTTAIRELYEREGAFEIVQEDPVQRAVASFVALSLSRREVWFVGDCQCLLNGQLLTNKKELDEITANARSLFLEAELAAGKTTLEALREHDTGRAYILPLLERQMRFQNHPESGQYWFAVIDGFAVPNEGIRVYSLPPDIETVVLASDGYPELKETLEASEQALEEILRDDPLLFRHYKATKGLSENNISFDDRAYVRLRISKAPDITPEAAFNPEQS